MMCVFFFGIGLASFATGFAATPLQMGIGLFVVGMFAAIYHPVGLANAPVAVALFCLQGAVLGAYPMAVRTMLNRLVPSAEKRATTLSFESLACRLCYGVVVIFFAWVMELLSLAQALPIVGLIGCVPFALMWILPRATSVDRTDA